MITLIKKITRNKIGGSRKTEQIYPSCRLDDKMGFSFFLSFFIDQADESHRFGTVRAVGKYQQTGYVQQTSPLVHGQGATRELY